MFRSCEIKEKPERKQPDRRIKRINEANTSVPIKRKTGQSLPPQGEGISPQKKRKPICYENLVISLDVCTSGVHLELQL